MMLLVNRGDAPAIGIDVGASKIVAAVVGPDGGVQERIERQRTPDSSSTSLVKLLSREVDTLRAAVPRVRAVGVGIAGLVTWPEGEIEFAANHGHRSLKLRRNLENACGLPVVVENDANAAAWAEANTDQCLDQSLLFLALGTGLGGGVVMNDRLVRGPGGRGVEVGHIVVDRDSPERCLCGLRGCLEALASGRALARAADQLMRKDPNGPLAHRVGRAEDKISAMIDAALAGDPGVVSLVRRMGHLIGRTVAENVMTLFPVDRVVVGGGLAVLGRQLLDPMRSACEKTLARSKFLHTPRIRMATRGPDAILIGAALLTQPEWTGHDLDDEMAILRGRQEPSLSA